MIQFPKQERSIGLPSVDVWYNNMNIVKEPPKSIMTTRRIKVTDTNEITQHLSEQWDRFDEAIQLYPRGVNPCVSVMYNNSGGKQASLPYKIMNGGAFRPPLQRQEDLVPLSRQPRLFTHVDGTQNNPDYTLQMYSSNLFNDSKYLKPDPLHAPVDTLKVLPYDTGIRPEVKLEMPMRETRPQIVLSNKSFRQDQLGPSAPIILRDKLNVGGIMPSNYAMNKNPYYDNTAVASKICARKPIHGATHENIIIQRQEYQPPLVNRGLRSLPTAPVPPMNG